MAANTAPIYSLLPDTQWIDTVKTANTTRDLTSGTIYLLFTAGANGGFVQKVRFRSLGDNIATVARLWLNNGSTTGTAANNTLVDEITLPATTASEVAAVPPQEIILNFAIPAGYILYVTVGTTVSAGYDVHAIAGKY